MPGLTPCGGLLRYSYEARMGRADARLYAWLVFFDDYGRAAPTRAVPFGLKLERPRSIRMGVALWIPASLRWLPGLQP